MNLAEIEQNVADLDVSKGFDLIHDLLRAYGIPKASISRLKKGTHDRAKIDNEHLWKGKLYYRFVDDGSDLYSLIDDAKNEERVTRERPRFLIVRDIKRLLAIDTKTETTLDIELSQLVENTDFFLPWAGIEKTQLETLNYADIKAAAKMAKLYDEIIKHNSITTESDVHHLNVFFSRLLFCFFAEDTGVFEKRSFTDSIASLTAASGEDTGPFLDRLFKVLNTKESERQDVPAYFKGFGYVNGKLFDQKVPSPKFSAKARKIILECGTLDWSQINPDIFGSMIQAVVHPSQREGLGMHYTSVENIMKVIRPLFLDELEGVFEEAIDSVRKLERLAERLAAIKVFDPACGSGNFLVIAYKELRKLEHRILQRLADLQVGDRTKAYLFKESKVKLENFYGIEIDDFAHEIAILSLWLAKHQMNVEFKELFGFDIPLIPLRDTGNIARGNATRLDWEDVCPKTPDSEIYVLGNPPYLGSSMQSLDNKHDFVRFFGSPRYPKNLDYISLWFLKGAQYIADSRAELAFVSTNSVCQGDHAGLMWPPILEKGLHISFAHTSFPWSNLAKGKAGVICVIVGISGRPRTTRMLYSGQNRQEVVNVNPYLAATLRNTIVTKEPKSLFGLPPMVRGNQPTDGGFLNMTPTERNQLLSSNPSSEEFIRPYVGAEELLNGITRYCLWIADADAQRAASIPLISERLERVKAFRLRSSTTAQSMANQPHRFLQRPYRQAPQIIVPMVSSERREYIPMDFLSPPTIVSNLANAIYGAEPWVLGLIQSRMHMVWVRTVAGRLKSDIRYSSVLCYNTFPVPALIAASKANLARLALEVIGAREHFPDRTLAQLYNPVEMPPILRRAHGRLDEAVDQLYQNRGFDSDDERLELLFEMYEEAVRTPEERFVDAY
jgi:type I restriction-modification system DNA methylase subunit